jgi:hypothetical protein
MSRLVTGGRTDVRPGAVRRGTGVFGRAQPNCAATSARAGPDAEWVAQLVIP